MSEKPDRPHAGNRAFTRVDLLALLASVALLLFIVLPALGRVTGKTIIAQCAANLEQYDLALQIYGNENQDNLPNSPGGNWVWDASPSLVAALTNAGVKWNNLYCPGTSPRFTEQDDLNLFNFEPGVMRVLGYASTLPCASFESGDFSTNVNTTLSMDRAADSYGWFFPIIPASRPLVADATLTDSGASFTYAIMLAYNWSSIDGGYVYNGHRKPHLSAHLNSLIPLGGNIGMLDGHVEWRNFKDMLPRDGYSPYFYW
jgi:prepilin-type processing-associated H-X9-DG protein